MIGNFSQYKKEAYQRLPFSFFIITLNIHRN